MGLQIRQVDFDYFVEVGCRVFVYFHIRIEVLTNTVGSVGDGFTAGGTEVTLHRIIVSEG